MVYTSVTVYVVHMLQYIMHKVLSIDYISKDPKQFKNEISSLKYHGMGHGCSVS